MTITLTWDKSAAGAAEAAAFAAPTVARDVAYISHGEIQAGLSQDGRTWAADLPKLYAEEFAALGDARSLLIARNEAGAIVGIAVLAWENEPRLRFAILEDIVVDPAFRSTGLGARIIAEIEREAAARDLAWIFLESGRDNYRAHQFIRRHGFEEMSHVFAKRLSREDDAPGS